MDIKTTDRGAEIIELIQFIIDERNTTLERLNLLDAKKLHNGSLSPVEQYTRGLHIRSLAGFDNHIKNLRGALHREHASVLEALGL